MQKADEVSLNEWSDLLKVVTLNNMDDRGRFVSYYNESGQLWAISVPKRAVFMGNPKGDRKNVISVTNIGVEKMGILCEKALVFSKAK